MKKSREFFGVDELRNRLSSACMQVLKRQPGTQLQISNRTGINNSYVSMLLRGVDACISTDALLSAADKLGVEVAGEIRLKVKP